VRTWRRAVVILFVIATAFLLYRWWEAARMRKADRSRAGEEADDDVAPATTGETARGAVAASAKPGLPQLDRAKADRMREQIRSLLAEGGASMLGSTPGAAPAAASSEVARRFPSMPTVPDGDAGESKVDPGYLKGIISHDFVPLAQDCYQGALAKNRQASGTAVLHFEIVGDRKVGGVVDDVKLLDGTTIDDPAFRTCVTESMMSVSFDAPPEDGTLSVTVPMRFSPTRRDGGGGD
jgi:hypothetical protein